MRHVLQCLAQISKPCAFICDFEQHADAVVLEVTHHARQPARQHRLAEAVHTLRLRLDAWSTVRTNNSQLISVGSRGDMWAKFTQPMVSAGDFRVQVNRPK